MIEHCNCILVAFSTFLCSDFLHITRTPGKFIPCCIFFPRNKQGNLKPLRSPASVLWEFLCGEISRMGKYIGVMWGIMEASHLFLHLSLLEAFSLPALFYLLGFLYSLATVLTLFPICATFKKKWLSKIKPYFCGWLQTPSSSCLFPAPFELT